MTDHNTIADAYQRAACAAQRAGDMDGYKRHVWLESECRKRAREARAAYASAKGKVDV